MAAILEPWRKMEFFYTTEALHGQGLDFPLKESVTHTHVKNGTAERLQSRSLPGRFTRCSQDDRITMLQNITRGQLDCIGDIEYTIRPTLY